MSIIADGSEPNTATLVTNYISAIVTDFNQGLITGGAAPNSAVIPEVRMIYNPALKGQPVWLTFGGTWCVDCRTEAPDLQAAAAKYRPQGLQVVGVFVGETSAQVTEYAKRVGLDYTFVPDPTTRITSRFKTLGYPTHLFIGRDGIIKEIRIGGLRPDEMDRLAESILR